jgi:hypothetical protein
MVINPVEPTSTEMDAGEATNASAVVDGLVGLSVLSHPAMNTIAIAVMKVNAFERVCLKIIVTPD